MFVRSLASELASVKAAIAEREAEGHSLRLESAALREEAATSGALSAAR